MARQSSEHPTQRELEILQVLWELSPAGLGAICEALRKDRAVATTTIATMLKVMLDKKLVKRRRGSRGYEWSANVSRNKAAEGLVEQVLDRVFDGSAKMLAAHLIDEGKLSPAELHELRQLIESKKISTKKSSTNKGGK